MADFKGSILELNGNKAIVMTDNCDFVTVKRQPDMAIGQERGFRNQDLYNNRKNYIKYIALAASVCLVVFSYFMFSQVYLPGTVFAYVDVDINPSIELTVDKNIQVIDTKPLNDDAKALLDELQLKKLSLKEAVAEVVKESEKLGYIRTDKENAILVSASLAKEENKGTDGEKALNTALDNIDKETVNFDNKEIETEVVKVSPENREQAVKNNMSMGRYALYNKIKQDDAALTIDEAKVSRVYDMLEKLHEMDNKGNTNKNNEETKQGKPDVNIDNSADKGNSQNNNADKYKEEKGQNQGNNTGGSNSPGPKYSPGAANGNGNKDNNPGKSNNEKDKKVDTGQNDDNRGLADKNVKPAETIDSAGSSSDNSSGQTDNNKEDKGKSGTGQSNENSNNGKGGNDKGNQGSDTSGSQNDKGNSADNGKNNKK